jgi:hypothetical protein
MGGLCTTTTEDLPTSDLTVTGTGIPSYVAEGGKRLFEQASELASGEIPQFTGPRIATYDGSKFTPEEQQALDLLSKKSDIYQPYLDQAFGATLGLGLGFDSAGRDELVGTSPELGTYTGATRDELIGQRPDLDTFTLDRAQPFLDIFQTATDPAVRDIERQISEQQIAARAKAARGGAGFGSRLGIMEGTLGAEGAQAIGDVRAQAAREGLGFAAGRLDADRAQAERDRAARFSAEGVMRGQFESDRDAIQARAERDRAARFGAESAARSAYETEEAARVRRADQLQSFAPLVQGLQEQAASGLLSAGEARRMLDQAALDLAYSDFIEQRELPFDRLNFAIGALRGVPFETTTTALRRGQQFVQSPSVYGQTLGGLGSLASAYYLSKGG